MPNRIEVCVKQGLFDAQRHIDSQRIANAFGLDADVEYVKVYTEDLGLKPEEVERFSRELRHPLVNDAAINGSVNFRHGEEYTHVIEVGYKPGVMDPEGRSAKLLAEITLGRKIPFERNVSVRHQRRIRSKTPLSDVQLRKIAGLFYNDTVQSYRIFSEDDLKTGLPAYMPEVRLPPPEHIVHYDLGEELDFQKYFDGLKEKDEKARQDGIRRAEKWQKLFEMMQGKYLSPADYFLNKEFRRAANWLRVSEDRSLALNIEEMRAIYGRRQSPKFLTDRENVGLSAKTTDTELELYGSTWSEHCKHKIFNARVTYREGDEREVFEHGIFTEFIKEPTLAIQKQKLGLIKSVLWDNSGVVDLDPASKFYVCFKCETHNSPSFMEPYGGAITGIVGVYRDPLGTGRGSQLTFGVWGYATGSPFYSGNLRPPLHPEQLLDGIHRGVRDGGNKHGVPTAIGGTFFDDSYIGKCLVYAGAAGLIPKDVAGRPGYEKWIKPGDRCIAVGGRVGKDGIHGATASSQEFSETTPAGHVQIGDPYTQKNVQEFMLDALAEGLINFAQDSGAGGTASAAGEMAQHSGGAKIHLDRDLFKYEGLASWEKLLSESQERMFLAVDPGNIDKLKVLAEKWSVEWRDIGEFNDTGYFHVMDRQETVAFADMEFLHKGVPQKTLNAAWITPQERGLTEPSQEFYEKILEQDPTDILHSILRRENIASKEFLQREYDTRVQGRTVIPAFIGKDSDVPSDAFVQKIEYGLESGIACGIGMNPSYSKIDTYNMAMMAANEGLMRVVAVGADPDRAVNNGNYCWPGVLPDESNDSEYKMAQLVRAAKAQRDFALVTGVATISGKDSMKIQGNILNDKGERQRVYGLPAIQFATIAFVPDVKKCVTSDFKMVDDAIYLVGPQTRDELGGSELYQMYGKVGLNAPNVDTRMSMDIYRRLHHAMEKEYVESAKVCAKGGIAVAASTAAFAGGVGAYIDLGAVYTDIAHDGNADLKLLYSETASRFVVSVMPDNARNFEQTMGHYARRIGYVTHGSFEVTGVNGEAVINEASSLNLKSRWQSTFRHKNYQGDDTFH